MDITNRQIGKIVKTTGVSALVAVSEQEDISDDKQVNQLRWSDYVLIKGVEYSCFGQVTELEIRESYNANKETNNSVFANILLLCSIKTSDDHSVFVGIREFPMLGAICYSLKDEFVRHVVGRTSKNINSSSLMLNIGNLVDAGKIAFSLTPESMFGRHSAVLGTSGGGKSWCVARLVEESAKHNCKVILLDATGEYSTLGPPVNHVHIGKPSKSLPKSLEVSMPYFQLLESDIFAIFHPCASIQAPKLRAAIKTLKLLDLEPHLSVNGTFVKANKYKLPYLEAYTDHFKALESNKADFDITKLPEQLKFECINEMRSATETDYWGNYNATEEASVFPLISKVNDVIKSSNLEPIFRLEGLHSLFDVMEWFITNDDSKVLCISLEHISFEHKARQLVANAMGRQLMIYARSGAFRVKPLVLIIDEAHQFLDMSSDKGQTEYPLDSFSSVAKEGRKYSFNICLATQRPCDIPEGVMSQMGTILAHRLINDRDINIIERSCSYADTRVLESLPSLAPGEAILLGVDIPIPLKIAINAPSHPPVSEGPNYQRKWKM